MDNRHTREEILKYWHVIEFLNQNEFPTIKNKKSTYVSTIGYLMSEQIDIFHKVKQDNFKIKEMCIRDSFWYWHICHLKPPFCPVWAVGLMGV